MSDKTIRLTRGELYPRVWETPATKLAKEFGISDVALGIHCKRLNIPKPYPGYWQQLEAGRKVHREPLPPRKPGIPAEVTLYLTIRTPPFQPEDPAVSARLEAESQPDNIIRVADTLDNPHPLVRQTKQAFEKAEPNMYGILLCRWDHPHLNIRVSKGSLRRALLIMDAILKALVKRGYSAEISKSDSLTRVLIGDEKLKIHLTEKTSRRERELTAEEEGKKRLNGYIPDRYVYTPTGKLTFEIDEYCGGCQTKWADKTPLEEQLNEILSGLITAAEYSRLWRIERENERRRQQEIERGRMVEQERVYMLDRHLEVWDKSRRVRGFIRDFESSLTERIGELSPESPEARWLRWANDYADRLDPLQNGRFEEALRRLT